MTCIQEQVQFQLTQLTGCAEYTLQFHPKFYIQEKKIVSNPLSDQ